VHCRQKLGTRRKKKGLELLLRGEREHRWTFETVLGGQLGEVAPNKTGILKRKAVLTTTKSAAAEAEPEVSNITRRKASLRESGLCQLGNVKAVAHRDHGGKKG